jgi:DNA-binding response OmpR family regulator
MLMAPTILVIDDEPDLRQLTAMTLESVGYHVVQAGSGPDGLTLISTHAIQLVILDVMMPMMDGWEVCRQIRSRQQASQMPVLFLTMRTQPLDRILATEVLDANAYLTKPVARDELLDMVDCLLSQSPSQQTRCTTFADVSI